MSYILLILLIALALILSVACTGYIAFAFRERHRFLFKRTLELGDAMSRLADALRIESRLAAIRNSGAYLDSSLPVRFTAQAGEDILIYDFFRDAPPGFFVEAGAYDGVAFSNTYLLESLGWKGLLVEPHPDYARRCERNRPGSVVSQSALGPEGSRGEVEFTCADNQAGATLSFLNCDDKHVARCSKEQCVLRKVRVPCTSLDDLLKECTDRVNFLSLDVEGMELDVLKGFDIERYRPEMILVESDGRQHDAEIEAYLQDLGYYAVGNKGCNRFFVPAHKRERFLSLPSHRPPLVYAE
jgi:FkbM family methyltransferase